MYIRIFNFRLREKDRLKILKKRKLRTIRASGTGRDGVTWQQRKLYNKELNSMLSPTNVINIITRTKIGWAGHVVCRG